ncbi:hypothetical protein L2E82_38396 [Cichorium intybus]|uniref:Uncharacterized protein n=1 Tax=Cichorium intybus TaxID=13427 RepID=A0ACB9AG79_CICIN|nr:hypothetical protein L2E82_38396 [Cichorium intybus]
MDRNLLLMYVKVLDIYIKLLMCLATIRVWLLECEEKEAQRRQLGQSTLESHSIRSTVIQRITRASDINCIKELRMDRNAFAVLCQLLQTRGGLLDDGFVSIEEQVAIFLNILAHHTKNRSIQVRFYRSGETISRYVHRVLGALMHLQDILFVKPTPVPNDSTDTRWKWFKGCLGAIDGTYIQVNVLESDKPRYRTRKGNIATNVLGVCNHDMNFVYVLAGWEGSATDSRVLRDAITRPNGLIVPFGNYYLADGGYINGEGFLAPYREEYLKKHPNKNYVANKPFLAYERLANVFEHRQHGEVLLFFVEYCSIWECYCHMWALGELIFDSSSERLQGSKIGACSYKEELEFLLQQKKSMLQDGCGKRGHLLDGFIDLCYDVAFSCCAAFLAVCSVVELRASSKASISFIAMSWFSVATCSRSSAVARSLFFQEFMHFPLLHRSFFKRFIVKAFHFRQMTQPTLALPPSGLPFLPMFPRRRPTMLRAYGVFARRSLPVVPSSPLAIWAGCPSLLRSVRLWIIRTNVVEWNSRRVTRSTVLRFEVQVVMITPGYALAPLTGIPKPTNARENPSRSILHSSDRRCG